MYEGKNYIDGKWCQSKSDIADINPSTEETIGLFPETEDTGEAVAHAHNAFLKWRKESRVKRGDLFDNLASCIKQERTRIANVVSEETGKTLNEARAEVTEALHMIQYVAGQGRQPFGEVIASEIAAKDVYTMRKPKGVVAVISPWNFPFAIGPCWCAAPAILEGNTVVFKPSEITPMVGQVAAELYDKAGFPPGVFNLVHGSEKTGHDLVRQNDVQTILFTGSAEAGQDIRKHCASTWHKTCSCEMGSKSAVMVCKDANIDLALDVSLASAFKLSGQRCVSAGRILIHEQRYDEFCKHFAERAGSLKTGDPFEPGAEADYGPLISQEQMTRVLSYNSLVEQSNHVNILVRGGRANKRKGYFLEPFVYQSEWQDERFLKEEVFGPHVALIPFSGLTEAIEIYNDTPYGLALGVVTENFRTMRRVRDECNFGMLYLNGGSIAAESHLPFGGVGKSGNGYKSAAGTFRAVTDEIAVTTNYDQKITWCQGMK